MKRKNWTIALVLGAALSCGSLWAQDDNKVTVPFRNPSGKRTLKVNTMNGSITVKGYDGKDAIIEATGAGRRDLPNHRHEQRKYADLWHCDGRRYIAVGHHGDGDERNELELYADNADLHPQ